MVVAAVPARAKTATVGRTLWRWSWIVTLPVSVLFVLWVQATFSRYEDFALRYKMVGDPPSLLHKFGVLEFSQAQQKLELELRRQLGATSPSVRGIYLYIDEGASERLASNLPHSGREEVKAVLRYPDGELRRVEVRHRGDYNWHWASLKKSIRIKTKKDDLFEGMRSFNLIAPKFEGQLHNELAYRLAERMQLLTPRHAMVNLWINGKNKGVFLLAEQLGESTLRHRRRMPGDLYKGEVVARDRYTGLRNDLFVHPRVWEKIAVNNHYDEQSFAPMEALIGALDPSTPDPAALSRLLDVEVWGRFLAFELLTQTIHYDRAHNWRLYFDPGTSKFVPVVWDPTGWHPVWLPRGREKAQADILPSSLHANLLRRPEFLLARQQALEDFFSSGSDFEFLEEVQDAIDELKPSVRADPDATRNFRLLTASAVERAMEELGSSIQRVFRDIEEAYVLNATEVRYRLTSDPRLVELIIDGRRPARLVRLVASGQPSLTSVSLAQEVGDRLIEVDITDAVSVRGSEIEIDLPLLGRFDTARSNARGNKGNILELGPGRYLVRLNGLSEATRVNSVLASIDGTVFEHAEQATQPVDGSWLRPTLPLPRPTKQEQIWEGQVLVTDAMTEVGDLTIRPGTEVRLGPGASILVEGRLSAVGTANNPIRFVPAAAGQDPWGAIMVRGRGGDGSRLQHVEMGHGSGFKTDLLEASGMLSFHDVRSVQISDLYLHHGNRVDDMLHVIYGDVEIVRSRFEDAPFDAIDLDVVDGVVRECVFNNNGNDALDLMTANVVVLDSQFQRSKDKGISVGENSRLVAINNLFSNNQIGVEVKDSSRAVVSGATFRGNVLALNAYQKNWRYSRGGSALVQFSRFDGTATAEDGTTEEQLIAAQRRSEIEIAASKITSEAFEREIAQSDRLVLRENAPSDEVLPGFAQRFSSRIVRRYGWKPIER